MTDMQRMRHATRTPEGAQAQWLDIMHNLAEQLEQQQQTFQQQAQQQQHSFQQMTQEVLSSYSQLFNIPLSYAQEGLKSARFPIEGYDDLTVEEILGALVASRLRICGWCVSMRSAPRIGRRSWSSLIAG